MNKKELKRRCMEAIDAECENIKAVGEQIYKNPELGYKEFQTTQTITEAFQTLGMHLETEIAYTGCKAYMDKKDGLTVGVIGELDCVVCADHKDSTAEGNVHACGHNVQLANIYGCAVGLIKSGIWKELAGNVEFIAIPAEECVDYAYRDGLIADGKISFYGGKQEYVKRGGFDDIDMVLQCHMMEMEDPKKACIINTDCNGFITKTVSFLGEASHAGFAPFEGINALNMAELALNNIHAQRETFKDEDKVRVSAIITEGGELVNVVPAKVEMQIMVRAFCVEAMMDASEKVNRALKAAALALGGKVEIRDKMGYLPMKTDRNLSALYRQNMIALAGVDEDGFVERYETAGSTDLGDISQMKPCMHIWASGVTGGLHAKEYQIADTDKAYILPAKMLAATVIDLLYENAEKAKEIKDNFEPSFTKESYLQFMKEHTGKIYFDGSQKI